MSTTRMVYYIIVIIMAIYVGLNSLIEGKWVSAVLLLASSVILWIAVADHMNNPKT